MRRSSDSVAAIAGALAKAQGELVNPEKTLTASVRAPNGERTFRYAPLSSGLDIIRKCLGKYEIAIVQSTSVDHNTRVVKLATILAHSSGEWLASEWPVCNLNEISSPQRMGAALTYGRRYALFALVGIAGEDDLDAPDVSTPLPSPDETIDSPTRGDNRPKLNGSLRKLPQESISIDQLLLELGSLATADQLTSWAVRVLPLKNRLTVEAARALEDAFQARLMMHSNPEIDNAVAGEQAGSATTLSAGDFAKTTSDSTPSQRRSRWSRRSKEAQTGKIDKSVLAIPTLKRQRNKAHLQLVARQSCLICARQPCDAHHLRFAQARGLSLKVSDEFTVPLCRIHHREVHRHGSELDWWAARGIAPLPIARLLWERSTTGAQPSVEIEATGGPG